MSFLPHPIRLDPRTRLPRRDYREVPSIWTPAHEWVWERASFTVPKEVSEERVRLVADKYLRKFGKALEQKGFNVLEFDGPNIDKSVVAMGMTEPDRRAYVLWAKVTRRPQIVTVNVPDEDVSLYQKAGFKLA